ncbi:hypothetical protein F5Y05DRAFT_392093 [Hypoxylon sp. FL0543]|nr:hypothetical protein F5Y05DRAFT_392093 [Hypoxylon sp. FL0543]
MHGTQKVSFDLIVEISKRLEPEDRIELALTRRELYSSIYPCMLRHVLFELKKKHTLKPVVHAIRTDNLPMLSTVYGIFKSSNNRKWHCDRCVRDWKWFLGYATYAERICRLAMLRSRKCFEFLLDSIDDSCKGVLSGAQGAARRRRFCIDPQHLLSSAINHREDGCSEECIDVILDRQHLFDLVGMRRPLLFSDFGNDFALRYNLTVPVAKTLIDHGIRFDPDAVSLLIKSAVEFKADLCEFIVNREGFDVGHESTGAQDGVLALARACYFVHPTAVELFLRLGANPNGVEKETDGTNFTRPIEILLDSEDPWILRRWPVVASDLYRCAKALVEHGASMSSPPVAARVIQKLLDHIWRALCPCARVAAGVGRGDVSSDRLLEALLTVDIEPFDKLFDMVVDGHPKYRRRTKGLRGKQRLVKLLSQRKALKVDFRWNGVNDGVLFRED